MVKVIRPDDRDLGTVQTPGMRREAGVCGATAGSQGLWMGVAFNDPGQASGAHHHGRSESGIYILEGRVRFRFGEQLENVVEAGPGDFVYVPPFEVHTEENLSSTDPVQLLVARNTEEAIVVNVPAAGR